MKTISFRKPVILSVVSVLIILLQRFFRNDRRIMQAVYRGVVRPIHLALISWTGKVRFSIAEIVILLTGISILIWFASSIIRLIKHPEKAKQCLKIVLALISIVLCIYAGFCVLWGVYYYSEDFSENTGIRSRDISVEELETVTAYFAAKANEYADLVKRDENGLYIGDKAEIIEKSGTLYREVEEAYPALRGPEAPVKPFFFSKLLSLTDFMGFFFPFTGEANVNMDFPPSLIASTAAHETAHQRGVAREQEANFCAVLSSFMNGDPDYCYSSALLAYTYLGNALYDENPDALIQIRSTLDERIIKDFNANREYWEKYETPVQNVSNAVYEEFLYSYDQDLGLKSYGACVDLLVSYYLEDAENCFQGHVLPSDEVIHRELFDPVLAFYPATAGSSLGCARALGAMLSFAAKYDVIEVEEEYHLLSEEEQKLYTENIIFVSSMLDELKKDQTMVIGLMEDAGVDEGIIDLTTNPAVIDSCAKQLELMCALK